MGEESFFPPESKKSFKENVTQKPLSPGFLQGHSPLHLFRLMPSDIAACFSQARRLAQNSNSQKPPCWHLSLIWTEAPICI